MTGLDWRRDPALKYRSGGRAWTVCPIRTLKNSAGRVVAVCDCLDGRALRGFHRSWEPGSVVESGPLQNPTTLERILERQMCIIIGPASWRDARRLVDRGMSSASSLASGLHWHWVLCE